MIEQDKMNETLNLRSKNITDDRNIFKELISSYPNVVNLDLSDNQLTYLPEDLSLLSKIQFLDIQGNNFNDVNRILFIINFIFLQFNQVIDSLAKLPNLIHLNINLNEQEQVKLIFEKLPNLEVLNDKKIKEKLNENENDKENEEDNENKENNIGNNENNEKENDENANIIDLNDEEIKNISLQDEIPNFNDIYKKITEKFKTIQKNNNLKDEFQELLKNEINKINSNNDNNIPNYIYSSNVIESQLCIYSFFTKKFLEFLSTQKDKDTYDLIKEIHDNMSKSYLLLIKIIYKLYPVVDEKIQMLKMQLNEAIKHNKNVYFELNENESKIKQEMKNKERIIHNYEDKISYMESKIKQLENENKYPSLQLNEYSNRNANTNYNNSNVSNNINNINNNINNSHTNVFINSNINNNNTNLNNQFPNTNSNNYNSNNNLLNYRSISYNNLNNSFNNNSLLQASPVCNRVFTIKMMKEIINDIYNSKAEFDKKSDENKLPRETLEQHMYTYLNQKYGLKSIIIEWASNIINGIKIFSSEDSEICLFGKILRNEIEEDARLIYAKLQQSIIEYLKYYFKSKNPFKSIKDINNMLKEKKTKKMLNEDEWKKIINYLYNNEDAKILEEKINDVIQKKFFKSKLDTDRKLTREEIIHLSKMKEEYNIPFKDLVKILHEFQIKLREKYLKNFVALFKNVDKDNNGIINEEEFVTLLYNMNIFGDQLKMKIVELLTQIDPNNNKQITFSECVNLFSNTPYNPDGSSNSNGSILDKICIGDSFN